MTFKELSFKKKLEHIWEYYKVPIFGIIFVIAAGCSAAYAILKPKPVNYAGIAVFREHISQEQTDALTDELNLALGLDDMNTVTVTNFFFDETDPVFNVDMEQKFVTFLFSLQLNLISAPKSDMEVFVQSEYVAPLGDYCTQEELDAFDKKGMLLYCTDPQDNEEKPFAVYLNDSSVYRKNNIFTSSEEPACIAVVPVAGFEANSKAALRQILKSDA